MQIFDARNRKREKQIIEFEFDGTKFFLNIGIAHANP